jgi:hypothetical protein
MRPSPRWQGPSPSRPTSAPLRLNRDTKTDELREAFLDFFVAKGCTRKQSDVLVPNDPTVLFTPAGMNQIERGLHAGNWFKEVAPGVGGSGGSGGGRPDLAQAGGKSPDKILAALEQAHRTMSARPGARAENRPHGRNIDVLRSARVYLVSAGTNHLAISFSEHGGQRDGRVGNSRCDRRGHRVRSIEPRANDNPGRGRFGI